MSRELKYPEDYPVIEGEEAGEILKMSLGITEHQRNDIIEYMKQNYNLTKR